jgi:hypothetical protein
MSSALEHVEDVRAKLEAEKQALRRQLANRQSVAGEILTALWAAAGQLFAGYTRVHYAVNSMSATMDAVLPDYQLLTRIYELVEPGSEQRADKYQAALSAREASRNAVDTIRESWHTTIQRARALRLRCVSDEDLRAA